MNRKKELELYVHIPFCVRKCAYCDFLSAPAGTIQRQAYVEALVREILGYRNKYQEYQVDTVFIGGGTPSILTPGQTEIIFAALRESFCIKKEAEITVEVNPGTVIQEKIASWKQAGVNRISLGLQSVKDPELRMLGRIHTYGQFLESFTMLRRAGFSNVNVDLISAIPGQTLESWRETLQTVLDLQPEHISAYSLILEEGTPLYEKYKEGAVLPDSEPALPDEETDRLIYEETGELLQAKGYIRYEISNYAKKGYACRHNIGYWRRKEYLGIGLGASSFIGNRRFRHVSDLQEYQKKVERGEDLCGETEVLSGKDEMEEFMFLGLRMMEGVKKSEFQRLFQVPMEQVYGEAIRRMQAQGLLEAEGQSVRLTKRGIDISNYVFAQFL